MSLAGLLTGSGRQTLAPAELAAAARKLQTYRGFYFHGGVPGLMAGDVLLPPSVTGARAHDRLGEDVFCSINPLLSAWFAATYPGGALYMVDPHPPAQPDPLVPVDLLGVTCPAATVIAVLHPDVPLESHAWSIAEALRQRPGRRDAYGERVIAAMRELGLLNEDTTAAQWAAAPELPPTWDDILRSYDRAVRALSPAEQARFSTPLHASTPTA